MERNKWETAIRCLEVALHPHTDDREVIAAVNGFRRTADGTPLSEVCRAFAAVADDGNDRTAETTKWRAKFDRLNRRTIDLRLKLDAETARLRETERRIDELQTELVAARRHAADAEQELADVRGAYRDRPEAADVATPRADAAPQLRPAFSPFHDVLAAARQRAGDPEPAIVRGAAAPRPRAPWTA